MLASVFILVLTLCVPAAKGLVSSSSEPLLLAYYVKQVPKSHELTHVLSNKEYCLNETLLLNSYNLGFIYIKHLENNKNCLELTIT